MQPEEAIKALSADQSKRSTQYEEAKEMWGRLLERIQASPLGEAFQVTGTVEKQDRCTLIGCVPCEIEVKTNQDDITIYPELARKRNGKWVLARSDHPKDKVIFEDEEELDALIIEYIVFTSKEKTDELLGGDDEYGCDAEDNDE
ncbi:hypothetical protein QR90_05045 [Deinococcus radiopugnans]|uniref:Uncharacterized protein n=1 Tax=Deinococcus radiopugnans TaxID=57497 RepID=A0A0A7KH86_9DEIO|nr:hypothetical protein [Deinococcus radiopugnans]AIZ44594.1 hypothetical protein QR90_05045 [Deinococcus radiopugnans]